MSIYESAWNALVDFYYLNIENKYDNINFDFSKKTDFERYFINEYKNIYEKYMDSNTDFLDRHKQAAILISDVIKNKVFFETSHNDDENIFIGLHQIAILLGISYMLDSLNEILKKNGYSQKVDSYNFPKAMSCNTSYLDILSRDLFFQDYKDNGVYILSLAHILFMIEFYTLKLLGIDTKILKEIEIEE